MTIERLWGADLLEAALRTVFFLLFTKALFPREHRRLRLLAAAVVIFASNLTSFGPLLQRVSGSLLRQSLMILAAAGVLILGARLQSGYALFLAVSYILGLGVWHNVITPFTLSQLVGMSQVPQAFPPLVSYVGRLSLGGLSLLAFHCGLIQMDPDGRLDAKQTFLSVFPGLVHFFVMLIFWYSFFRDKSLVLNAHFTAFAWIVTLLAFSSLITLTVANQVLFAQRREEELRLANQRIQSQYEQFECQRQSDEALRTLRHDMTNHLNTLSGLLSQEGAAQTYVAQLLEQTGTALEELDTGNPTLNVVLKQKTAMAAEQGIILLAYVNMKQGGFISPMDICTLFSNCIDNAVEAIGRDRPEDRTVTVRGGVIANCIVVKFENRYRDLPRFFDGLPVTSKTEGEHGLGLRSVRRVLERYGGVMDIAAEEGLFTLTWMIPLP